jgi:DNA replication protein DnaC
MTGYINLESDIAFEVIKDNLFKKNIFITGKPGSGKTYLTNKITKY